MAIRTGEVNLFDILKQIDQRDFAQVYFLSGESFQRDEALKVLLNALTDEATRAFNLDILDGEEANSNKKKAFLEDVSRRACTFPMMGIRRVVVVQRADSLQLSAQELTKLISGLPESTVFIITGDKFDGRTLKGLQSSIDFRHHNFGRVYENKLGEWIKAYLGRIGNDIKKDALEFLIDSEGENLGTITTEIEKINSIIGDRDTITMDDTRKVIGQFRTFRGYDIADAIISGDTAKALEVLQSILASNQKTTSILFDMVNHFTTLGFYIEYKRKLLSADELARFTGKKPYWHQVRFEKKLGLWDAERVADALYILGETESALKKSHLTDQHVFETLILRLTDLIAAEIPSS